MPLNFTHLKIWFNSLFLFLHHCLSMKVNKGLPQQNTYLYYGCQHVCLTQGISRQGQCNFVMTLLSTAVGILPGTFQSLLAKYLHLWIDRRKEWREEMREGRNGRKMAGREEKRKEGKVEQNKGRRSRGREERKKNDLCLWMKSLVCRHLLIKTKILRSNSDYNH